MNSAGADVYAQAARRLLEGPSTAGDGGELVAAGASRVCKELVEFMSKFLGEAGASALFSRSLVLARREHAWLPGAPALGDESSWARLRAAMEANESAANDASIALVSAFIRLIATFVGARLAFQILHQHRPEAFPLGGASGSQHDGTS